MSEKTRLGLETLNLSYDSIKSMTGWEHEMIEDWLTNLRNFIRIANETDGLIDEVELNREGIEANAVDIETNKDSIEINATAIKLNADNIVELRSDSQETFTFAAYGGVSVSAWSFAQVPAVNFPIGYDTAYFTTPRNVVQNTVSDGLNFDYSGVYELSTDVRIQYDAAVLDRVMTVSLTSPLTFIESFDLTLPANSTSSSISLSAPYDMPVLEIGGDFQTKIRSSDLIENIIVKSKLTAKSIGEFRGNF